MTEHLMTRHHRTARLAALLFLLAGCASQYRTIELVELTVVESEDGRKAAIERQRWTSFVEVIERSPNVKSVTRMTDLLGKQVPFRFSVSPDGKWIVYQAADRKPEMHYNLWKIQTGGGAGATQMTRGNYFDVDPMFDHGGTNIYFASNRSSATPTIWRVQSNGAGGIVRITNGSAVDRMPHLTPADAGVYYTSRPSNARVDQIWRVQANGSLPTQLREGFQPRVSPNGKQLLYSFRDTRRDKTEIWVMNTDGTNQTRLLAGDTSDRRDAAWSPDGTHIVYASNEGKDSQGNNNFDIWMAKADGSNPTQLTTNGSADFVPQWSPDGRMIYFLSSRGFHFDIWRMEIAGD